MIWRVFFLISGQLGRCSQRSLYASPYMNPYEYGFASQIQKKIPIGQLYPSLFSTIDNKEQFEVLIHTVSSQNFRSFCFLPFLCHFTCQKIVQLNFSREVATYTSRLLSFDKFLKKVLKVFKKSFSKTSTCFLWRQSVWKCI